MGTCARVGERDGRESSWRPCCGVDTRTEVVREIELDADKKTESVQEIRNLDLLILDGHGGNTKRAASGPASAQRAKG